MILVDAHVHLHGCFRAETFLQAALTHFNGEARRQGAGEGSSAVLMLTETPPENQFAWLRSHARGEQPRQSPLSAAWSVRETEEGLSLLVEHGNLGSCSVMGGWQVVTRERLEVLALMTPGPFPEGMVLAKTVAAVRERGGIPVIPWGFGKWWGRRGKVLMGFLLQTTERPWLFLGDNGGRPCFWGRPHHFTVAAHRGIRILPGSDPLPFASEEARVGSFGAVLPGNLSRTRPARDLRALLCDPDTVVRPYGRHQGAWRFFRNQFAIHRTRHRLPWRQAAP
jgi:hypothetical protein